MLSDVGLPDVKIVMEKDKQGVSTCTTNTIESDGYSGVLPVASMTGDSRLMEVLLVWLCACLGG